MVINLNEINELGDSELAFKTLSAMTQNIANDEEKLLVYQHAFKHYENGLLKINPNFFTSYSRHLYLKKDYEHLNKLFEKIPNISSIVEYYILLCFELGKVAKGINASSLYLEKLASKGLASKALDFFDKIKNYHSNSFNFELLYLKLLIAQGNDLLISKSLEKLRVEYVDHQRKISSHFSLVDLVKKVVALTEYYSYKSLELFKELMRWRILNLIYNPNKLDKGNIKNILDFFIITEELTDYIYLACLFNGQNQSWYKVFKSYTKGNSKYNSKYILEHHPYFFSVFKDHLGEQNNTFIPTKLATSTLVIENEDVVSAPSTQTRILSYPSDQVNITEYEKQLKNKIVTMFKEHNRNIEITDLLIMLRSLEFYDLMDTLFWKAHDRDVITEADIYLVGKTFFDLKDYSRAFSVLSYSKEEEGIKLFQKTMNYKKNQNDE